MNRKMIFIGLIFLLLLLVSACNRSEDPTTMVVVNNPFGGYGDKLVFEPENHSNILFKGEGGLSYYKVKKSGAVELVNYEGNLPSGSNVTSDENGVHTYTFAVENETLQFQIYKKPQVITGDPEDIVLVVFRYDEKGLTFNIGQPFNPSGVTAYLVQRDGVILVLTGDQNPELFDDLGYDPFGESEWKSQQTFNVLFRYEDLEPIELTFYVGTGEKPISNRDAKFFDWILVIPVAFIMSFFSGLLWNNFALGILFTTIVVRTLAWPIYAKSNDLSIKMNLAQPDMQRVQAKYATRKDPQSQQMQQMEMMQVYKKHGINFFGCLLPFLQMPIFIAMFNVVRRISLEGGMFSENVTNTMFFGINLSRGQDGIIGMFLAGIVGGTMFLLQKISMKKPSYAKNTSKHNPNPQAEQTEKTMKFVMYFMVFMMAFYSYQSNALALYWIFGNLYSLGQTLINRKVNEKKHEKLKQKQLLG
jgi:YidC/Oxa1 family membrane protein insertase